MIQINAEIHIAKRYRPMMKLRAFLYGGSALLALAACPADVIAQSAAPTSVPGPVAAATCPAPLAPFAANSANQPNLERLASGMAKNVLSRGPGGAGFDDIVFARMLLWLGFEGTKDRAIVNLLPAEQQKWSPDFYPEGSPELTRQVLACFPYLAAAIKPQEDEAARRTPEVNILKRQYENYIFIKRCYEVRQGYMVVYISEPEMARAKHAISSIEGILKPQLPADFTTEALWSQAEIDQAKDAPGGGAMTMNQLLTAPGDFGQRMLCQRVLNQLEQTYAKLVPQENTIRKDF